MEKVDDYQLCNKIINYIFEIYPDTLDVLEEDVLEKINFLRQYNCSDNQIYSICSSNPFFLNRSISELKKLSECLYKYGFDNIDLLLESNSFILNLEAFEIDNYIKKRILDGEILEDIIDQLESEPILFNEL